MQCLLLYTIDSTDALIGVQVMALHTILSLAVALAMDVFVVALKRR